VTVAELIAFTTALAGQKGTKIQINNLNCYCIIYKLLCKSRPATQALFVFVTAG